MISFIAPLPIGNAVKIILDPPRNSSSFALLRNLSGSFSSPDNLSTDDMLIDSAKTTPNYSEIVVDTRRLENGTEYFYCPFYLTAGDWLAGDPIACTPAATYEDRSVDAMTVILDRVAAGLRVELDRGNIKHQMDEFPVLSAPPQFDDTRWPVVSVHMDMEAPKYRAIGEEIFPDDSELEDIDESEGWYAASSINVIGWSLNPDERILIRQALRRIAIGNLAVFEGMKMHEISISQSDTEDFESYSAPVYMCTCTISSVLPVQVGGKVEKISSVKFTAISVDVK